MKQTTVAQGWQEASRPIAGDAAMQDRMPGSEAIAIACHENDIPPYAEAELERLYGSMYSSLAHFRIYGGDARNVDTYVVRKDFRIIEVFLFRREKRRVTVINEVLRIDKEEIDRFAAFVFKTYQSIDVISFHAIHTDAQRLEFPCQRFNCLEDMVLALPESAQDYLGSLGKNTRRNVRRYMERIRRDFPSFGYSVYSGAAVNEAHLHDIVRLSRARMAGKNKASAIDVDETRRIVELARHCGLVGVVTIDGRVCAGAISYRAGENYFLSVIAHDPAHDDYWLGILCCYLTICECIARGGKEFHFLWGRYDYKFALQAVQRNLDHLVVYRSRAQILINAGLALRTAFEGYIRLMRLRLDNARHRNGFLTRHALRFLRHLRSWRRLPQRIVGGSKDVFRRS